MIFFLVKYIRKLPLFTKIIIYIGIASCFVLIVLAFMPNTPSMISFWHWLFLVLLFIIERIYHFKTKKQREQEKELKRKQEIEQLLTHTDALIKSIEQKK
jgi:flagellar biosynthesis component FlhA